MINKFSAVVLFAAVFISCKKDIPAPVNQPGNQPQNHIEYTDLQNREVKHQQGAVILDVNKDDRADLFFEVRLVGDHINKLDKLQYYLLSSIYTAVPVNRNEQITPLAANEIIPIDNFNGSNWYGGSEIVLMERHETVSGTIRWFGNWIHLQKMYLPICIFKNNQRYIGWVQLTADNVGERLVLHRMAVSKLPEKEIKAGA